MVAEVVLLSTVHAGLPKMRKTHKTKTALFGGLSEIMGVFFYFFIFGYKNGNIKTENVSSSTYILFFLIEHIIGQFGIHINIIFEYVHCILNYVLRKNTRLSVFT